jgi:isocitrate dehydrogenase
VANPQVEGFEYERAMKLHVEVFHDNEVDQWGYTVPALSIVGTGCNSRDDAERFAVEAIQVAIESGDDEVGPNTEVLTFDVQIARAV